MKLNPCNTHAILLLSLATNETKFRIRQMLTPDPSAGLAPGNRKTAKILAFSMNCKHVHHLVQHELAMVFPRHRLGIGAIYPWSAFSLIFVLSAAKGELEG